jgi:hypothetical protein
MLGRRTLLELSVCDDTPQLDVEFVTGLSVLREATGSYREALEGEDQ